MRPSELKPREKEMGSVFCALWGKGAKDPGQGIEAQRQGQSLGGEGTSKERAESHEKAED